MEISAELMDNKAMNPTLDRVLQELADVGWTFDLLKQLTPADIDILPVTDGPKKPSQLLMIKAAVAKAKAEDEAIDAGPQKRRKQSEEKEQNRKHYVSEVLASIKRTAPESANEVKEMFQRLLRVGSDLDICVVVDATESMVEHLNRVKVCIERVAQILTERVGMTARFALVAYRDYGDILRHEVFDFGDSAALCRNLNTLKVEGGGDTCEDCFGGLWKAANSLPWAAPARVILWLGDAPQHGKQYNGGEDDSFPEGDLDGMTAEKIFSELRQKGIILVFGELKAKTNAMIAQLKREVAPFGSNLFLTYNCESDMGDFLTNALHTTVSLTRADMRERHGRGEEKPLTLVRLNWDFSPFWGDEEAGNVYTFEAYSGGDLHPLFDLMFDGPNTLKRQVTFRMTRNPVERGEQRFAFYALITEGRDWLFRKRIKKGVTKISRYEGGHNSKEALMQQAHIQEVARFLSQEFTLQLAKHSQKEKVIYVPVELLRIPERTTGDNFYSLEPFIPGNYVKFNNNNGFVDKALEKLHPLMQTFSHFTYSYSKGLVMVTDVQGVVGEGGVYTLTDPAVHTADPTCLLDPTNLGRLGMATFFKTHICNDFCRLLSLELPANLNAGAPIQPPLGIADARVAAAEREELYPSLYPNS